MYPPWNNSQQTDLSRVPTVQQSQHWPVHQCIVGDGLDGLVKHGSLVTSFSSSCCLQPVASVFIWVSVVRCGGRRLFVFRMDSGWCLNPQQVKSFHQGDHTWFFELLSTCLSICCSRLWGCNTCASAPSWFIIQFLRPDVAKEQLLSPSQASPDSAWGRILSSLSTGSLPFSSVLLNPGCCRRSCCGRNTLCCFTDRQWMESRNSCLGQDNKNVLQS